ncbi:MAG: NAD(P)(+) transhydrogenase (Re/Si-specific) subunit beta [Bradymonadaceae bacterium]|nr:NAD(P)(+) transhydrogenase (Re/Si-specific) subunit beta [Lujinxingiaceae bacterium]
MPENFDNLLTIIYLIAAVLFISSLGSLSKEGTARRGNLMGMIGMALAIGATFLHDPNTAIAILLVALGLGAVLGALAASRVAMTMMPELVAILHSFVGLAAVLVGFASYLGKPPEAINTVFLIEVYVAVAVGALTFTGSIVAWAKLSAKISGAPLLLPGRHVLNALLVLAMVGFGVLFTLAPGPGEGMMPLLVNALIASIIGVHLVLAIGGADMPVVVSLLNSYSGWAAAAAGFMLSNDLLIVTGALVGSSGAILSYIMCRAMNRSIWNVVFAGFGTSDSKVVAVVSDGIEREVRTATAAEVAVNLKKARRVIIVPGYGMAVAKAQHSVSQMTRTLRAQGVEVHFGIHPVAGRMPGHMNVLLAEADIPYEVVLEMDEINRDFRSTDVVLVIGANDIVNPDALTDRSSPIYGMPQLTVWDAAQVYVLKRSLSSGYAGVGNSLFFKENTSMFFGDANTSIDDVLKNL